LTAPVPALSTLGPYDVRRERGRRPGAARSAAPPPALLRPARAPAPPPFASRRRCSPHTPPRPCLADEQPRLRAAHAPDSGRGLAADRHQVSR
jgi:hypothetical protein